MHRFDYSFLQTGMLPGRLIGITAKTYALATSTRERKTQYPTIFTSLEDVARVQSVKTSNALEGIVTSDERITSIVNGSIAPLGHDELEIAGYRDALALIHEDHTELDFRVSDILHLHHVMLSLSGALDAGEFKESDNLILQVENDGKRSIRFRPLAADETPEAMAQLELAYSQARSDGVNPLLLIPCVLLDFLCIHPFRDGNGRLSRILSLLLLYREGFDIGKYISFEKQISQHKKWYYSALHESSINWHESRNDYVPFIEHFIATVQACYCELEERFAMLGGKKLTKAERVEAALAHKMQPLSKAELARLLPDIAVTTIEAALGELVRSGRIRKVGAGRSTKYIFRRDA